MTHCQGVVDVCYSTTSRHRGNNYHHRSRVTWQPKNTGKRVSFAELFVSYMGENQSATDPSTLLFIIPHADPAPSKWYDPMGDELLITSQLHVGAPTLEQRIMDMLKGATDWPLIQLPRGEGNLEGGNFLQQQLHIATPVTEKLSTFPLLLSCTPLRQK